MPAVFHHDPLLLILALAVCVGGALSTFTIYGHRLEQGRRHPRAWLWLTGLCAAASIWATHFVAMLAHHTELPTTYNLPLTVASFAVALAMTTYGLHLSLWPGLAMSGIGGAVIGLGIAAMHFVGMQALIVPATFEWNWSLVALSILLGTFFAASALIAYRRLTDAGALLSASLLFALAICTLHFTAMSALDLTPAPGLSPPWTSVDDRTLALSIASTVATVLLASYVVALIDGRASRESIGRMSELVEATIEGLVIAERGVIVNVNSRTLELCGRPSEGLIGKRVFGDLLTPPNNPGDRLFEAGLRCADGSSIPVEVVRRPMEGLRHGDEAYALRDLRDREEAALCLARANEELYQREIELRGRNLILDTAVSTIAQGLCVYDEDQRVVISNPQFATMYGLAADAIRPGMALRDVVQLRIDNGVYAGASPEAYVTERLAPVYKPQNSIHHLNNGRIIAVARRPTSDRGWVTTHEDITERHEMEQQLKQLAQYDALTGLLHRGSLRDRLEQEISGSRRGTIRLAVLVIAIDRFGELNHTLGHAAGDALLKSFAKRLEGSGRRSSILGRLGDDTFALVDVVEHPGRDATELAVRLLEDIRKPFTIDDTTVDITATIGIAVYPADGQNADMLIKNAALALDHGKREKRDFYHFFQAGLDQEVRARRSLERDLKVAVEQRQFELHYQPIVNLASNELVGFEALLRWRHPERGLIPPAQFIPLAEDTGAITPIGEWAVQQACLEAMNWPNHLTISVNIGLTQFWSAGFVPSIIKALASSGLPAQRLEIEVTERLIQDHSEEALKVLKRVADLGVLVALDDFGVGFSSLTYMSAFRFHKVKIDRSFVSALETRSDARVIVRTLARLGTGLGVITTAEGVETKGQLDAVRTDGCTEMQGYYFSPPRSAAEIRKFLSTNGTAADEMTRRSA